MLKLILLLPAASILLLTCGNVASAQNRTPKNILPSAARVEIGITAGSAIYQGDLVPSYFGSAKDAMLQGSVLVRYYLSTGLSIRGNFVAGALKGDDAQWATPAWRQQRNFKFSSPLYELSAMLEYDFLRRYSLAHARAPYGLYLLAGAGVSYTSPNRDFSGLNAEYFGSDDKAVSGRDGDYYAIPRHFSVLAIAGLGVRYHISPVTTFFAEAAIRQTFTDKMDGFDQSVSSPQYDAYTLYSAGVSMRLPGVSSMLPCPRFQINY